MTSVRVKLYQMSDGFYITMSKFVNDYVGFINSVAVLCLRPGCETKTCWVRPDMGLQRDSKDHFITRVGG